METAPLRKSSIAASTGASGLRPANAPLHAKRHEFDGVSSCQETDENGTSARGIPTDATSFVSVQRRRKEPCDTTSTKERCSSPNGNTQPCGNSTRSMSSQAPRFHHLSWRTAFVGS